MRRRLTLLAVLSSSVAVLLFALPLAVAVKRYLATDERNELQRAAASVASGLTGDLTARRSTQPGAAGEQTVTVYSPAGLRLSGSGPLTPSALVRAALAGSAGIGTEDKRLVAAAPVSDGDSVIAAVTVSSSIADLTRRIAIAWAEMASVALIAIVLTAIAARIYSRRLSVPLEQLAATAQRVGSGQRDARAPHSAITELDTVARALNDGANQLHAALDRERQFSANASHQLRSPLAGLRLELETALIDTHADPRVAMSRALAAADHLQDTIDVLLAIARDQPASVTADVNDALVHLRSRWTGPLAAQNRALRIDDHLLDDHKVRCSAAALTQIINILLENALQHGTGAVTITARPMLGAVAIDVSNPGPDIVTPDTELFRRRNDRARGHGIGLALARSLADADGSRLVLTSASPPTFTLLMRVAQSDDRTEFLEHRPSVD